MQLTHTAVGLLALLSHIHITHLESRSVVSWAVLADSPVLETRLDHFPVEMSAISSECVQFFHLG